MLELERDWSYEEAIEAHMVLDALELADEEARQLAEREAAERARGGGR